MGVSKRQSELRGTCDVGQVDKLLVLCATNMPWAIDGALLRRCQKRLVLYLNAVPQCPTSVPYLSGIP